MSTKQKKQQVEKLRTGIAGFDLICDSGLPKGRTTLVSGTAGSAKTIPISPEEPAMYTIIIRGTMDDSRSAGDKLFAIGNETAAV